MGLVALTMVIKQDTSHQLKEERKEMFSPFFLFSLLFFTIRKSEACVQ